MFYSYNLRSSKSLFQWINSVINHAKCYSHFCYCSKSYNYSQSSGKYITYDLKRTFRSGTLPIRRRLHHLRLRRSWSCALHIRLWSQYWIPLFLHVRRQHSMILHWLWIHHRMRIQHRLARCWRMTRWVRTFCWRVKMLRIRRHSRVLGRIDVLRW